jgi:hypothetical protein
MTEQKGTPYTTAVHLPVHTSNTAWLHCSGFTRGTTPENMRTAHHAFDGDLHTCWVHGAGDALVYDFHRPVPVVSYTLAGYERSHCVVRIDCTACLTHRQLCRHGQLRFANDGSRSQMVHADPNRAIGLTISSTRRRPGPSRAPRFSGTAFTASRGLCWTTRPACDRCAPRPVPTIS